MQDEPTIRVETLTDGIVRATLNRPHRLNALSPDMFEELSHVCASVDADPDARVLILTGAGEGFCAGMDLDEAADLLDLEPYEFLGRQERWAGAVLALRRLRVPVIAAIHGAASGAGLSLALACDLRVASTTARFNAAFIKLGLTGGDLGSSWMLPKIIGLGLANELLLTGRSVDVAEAERIGLVNQVVAPCELEAAALKLARQIGRAPALSVKLTKHVIQSNLGAATLEQALEIENRNQTLAVGLTEVRDAVARFRSNRL